MTASNKVALRLQTNREAHEEFIQAIIRLKTCEEAEAFFKDLFSSSEIKDITRRFKCAKLLFDDNTFQEITDLLGMSPLTINKIHFKTRGSRVLPRLFS